MKPFNPTSPTLTSCDRIWLAHAASGRRESFRIRENRRHKGHFLLGFEGIDSLTALEPWLGSIVEAESTSVPAPDPSEVYHFEVVGLEVRTTSGEVVGRVAEVLAMPAQDVWVIHVAASETSKAREILLPATKPVLVEIDLPARVAVIDPPPGLLDA